MLAQGEEAGLQGRIDLKQAGYGRQQEKAGHPGGVVEAPVLPRGKFEEFLEVFSVDGVDRDVGVNLPDDDLQVHRWMQLLRRRTGQSVAMKIPSSSSRKPETSGVFWGQQSKPPSMALGLSHTTATHRCRKP